MLVHQRVNELLHVVMSMYRGYLGWICLQLGSRDAMRFLRHSARKKVFIQLKNVMVLFSYVSGFELLLS